MRRCYVCGKRMDAAAPAVGVARRCCSLECWAESLRIRIRLERVRRGEL